MATFARWMTAALAAAGLAATIASGARARAAETDAADAGAPTPSSIPACIGVKTESRWVPYGYNHVVILTSGCEHAASCVVSTDVNPERQQTTVPPGKSVEITTFMGSPSSAFTAKVGCTLR